MRNCLTVAICASFLISFPVQAQQSIADQKDAVALEAAKQALDAARQKQLLDALAAVKQPTEGKATLADPALTAEGLMLVDHGLRSASAELAAKVVAWRTANSGFDNPLLVVMGAQAPSVAQWQSFDRMATELETKLGLVAADWKTLTKGGAGKGGDQGDGTVHPFLAALPALAIVSTVASLLKTDYGIGGAKVGPTSDAMRAIVIDGLAAKSVPLALPEFLVATEPSGVKSRLDKLKPMQEAASDLYHGHYLKRLAAAGGKPDKLDPAIAAAGTNLATALSDYDALVKSLYTPVGAVLPAVEVERQRLLSEAVAKQPILYVTGYSANLTTVTKKGFLSGISTTPTTMRVAATIDYAIAGATSVAAGHVVFNTEQIPFGQVGFTGVLPKSRRPK